jgi:hypothetical protein
MRPTVAVLLAAVLIVAAGGAAVASNMGFKFNKPLIKVGAGPGFFTGIQYASIPYNNPYGTINGFCTQTGLISTGITRTRIQTLNYTVNNEGYKFGNCGTTPFGSTPLVAGMHLEIRQPAAGADSIIIVGSHNSSTSIGVQEGLDVWFSVPYHTTAVTSNDLCTQIGLTSAGITRATVERLVATYNPPQGPFQTHACGSTSTVFNLVLGEGVRFREANGVPGTRSFAFVPAHY